MEVTTLRTRSVSGRCARHFLIESKPRHQRPHPPRRACRQSSRQRGGAGDDPRAARPARAKHRRGSHRAREEGANLNGTVIVSSNFRGGVVKESVETYQLMGPPSVGKRFLTWGGWHWHKGTLPDNLTPTPSLPSLPQVKRSETTRENGKQEETAGQARWAGAGYRTAPTRQRATLRAASGEGAEKAEFAGLVLTFRCARRRCLIVRA